MFDKIFKKLGKLDEVFINNVNYLHITKYLYIYIVNFLGKPRFEQKHLVSLLHYATLMFTMAKQNIF